MSLTHNRRTYLTVQKRLLMIRGETITFVQGDSVILVQNKFLELLVDHIENRHHTRHGYQPGAKALHQTAGALLSNNIDKDVVESAILGTY